MCMKFEFAFFAGHGILIRFFYLFFLAAVFYGGNFNGDLNQWDVATVTDMSGSKSTHAIVIGWFRQGFRLKNDRKVVLKNAGDWAYSHGRL